MKLLLLTPLALMACAHQEPVCYTVRPSPDVFLASGPCTNDSSERGGDRAHSSPPPATSPGNPDTHEPAPPAHDGDNGGSSEGNGDSSDSNGGDSDERD